MPLLREALLTPFCIAASTANLDANAKAEAYHAGLKLDRQALLRGDLATVLQRLASA